jgi:hypothetical protein
MQHITVIVLKAADGATLSVRTHEGHSTDVPHTDALYYEELEADSGLQVEFWPLEHYTDVGDLATDQQARCYRYVNGAWTSVQL